ncbi:putative disease resistance protein [Camellia lanceoleosa]|uniref:Disease resistance protein n=1 Tax=Camellia lanceoleosa TaxID=1840588 RepID=A0ACC0GN25_9ERIC|nr:putative disease resistance protein [Camellia lanceoleosa]
MTVLGALISAGGSVVGVLVKPVGRQFGYVFHRQKYIEDLREQVQNLEAHRKDVDDLIDEAKRDRKEILQTVENWIERVDRFIVEAKEFLEGGTNVNQKCLNGWFPDLVTRRRLGKEAKNKAEEAKELGEKGKFNGISKTARPLGMESIPSKQLAPYASTNLTMTNVMEALIDDKINFIGIHGIGGVGKTTLVKEIGKKAKSDKLFDEVVMAVVSQNQGIEKIQDDIAGMLGFTSLINQRSKTEREGMLCERLKDVKKILVILDDVWDKLDLAAVGIPFGNDYQGCKIIITTRREQVCNSMGMERLRTKIVHLGVLSEEDSWDLFKKNVGDVLDSDVLNVVANKVCKECGGLPIALVTVGSAMKGKDDPTLWDEAARELRKSMPTNIEDIGSEKYFVRAGCNLNDWPKIDSLDQYTGISFMRNQISNLPEVLECPKLQILLLQDNENARSCSHEFFSWMNALSVLDFSQQFYYHNPIHSPDLFNHQMCLRTLVLARIRFGDTKFLGQLKTLEVLSLRGALFSEAPNAIRELTNLRLLDMTESCHEFLIPAAMVSPLSHLEELYLFGTKYSRRIRDPAVEDPDLAAEYLVEDPEDPDPAVEVAAALRSWPRLKVLTISIPDIAYIPKDFVFPELESFIIFIGKLRYQVVSEHNSPNYLILGNLVGTMVNWSKWLKMVLNRATHLRIEDCSELEYLINTEEWGISSRAQPRDLQLLFNLEKLELFGLDSFKGICAVSALTTSSWVCFPKLRRLEVYGCHSLSTVLPFNLLQRLQHLENLNVGQCEILERVFDFGSEGEGMKLVSSLRDLTLWKLPRLKHLLNCSSRQHVQLCNLRKMEVHSCGKLKYVFQPSIAQALHQLESLWVMDCEEMEEIVAVKQNEGQQEEEERVDYKMVFKSLKQLTLWHLPNLSGFCTGGDDFPFEWPSLELLTVKECPKMKTFAATTSGSTPKLKEVELDYSVMPLQGMDLNQFVQTHIYHFKAT